MAFEYSPKEFIKMYRKLLNWEWYTDTNTKALFIHCLLRANWKAGQWKGIHYKAGEFITSLPSIAEELGMTQREVRTALNHLISTGELTSKLTDSVTGKPIPKGRIITVNNWNEYQGNGRQVTGKTTGNRSGKRQASDRQATAEEEHIRSTSKKEKEDKETALPVSSVEDPAAALPEDDDIYLPEDIVWDDPAAMTEEEAKRWIHDGHL